MEIMMKVYCYVIFGFFFSCTAARVIKINKSANLSSSLKHPLIIVPGDGGCQAYAALKNNSADPFLIWFNLHYFLVPKTFNSYFGLNYDNKTHKSHNGDAVDIMFPGWGETWSVENLDTVTHERTTYFGTLVKSLTTDSYFVTNRTLRAAPYDFRKAPNENLMFSTRMKSLIEETFELSGNQRIVLLGHSMGALYSLYFLKRQSDEWKKKYIKAFISANGPFGGSVKALKLEASGDNLGVFIQSPLNLRHAQRSFPSSAFLLPDSRLWTPDEPLIITPETNYSAHDYKRFFSDIGFPDGYQMLLDTKPLVDGFVGPTGIDELYCIHGVNVTTVEKLVYAPPSFIHKAFPDQAPAEIPGNGDGTVSLRSLQVCRNWPGVNYITLPGNEHMSMIKKPNFIEIIQNIVGANPNSSSVDTEIPVAEAD